MPLSYRECSTTNMVSAKMKGKKTGKTTEKNYTAMFAFAVVDATWGKSKKQYIQLDKYIRQHYTT
jgi:hypothetical protein